MRFLIDDVRPAAAQGLGSFWRSPFYFDGDYDFSLFSKKRAMQESAKAQGAVIRARRAILRSRDNAAHT